MGGRSKLLGDYLTDRHFPLPLRERLPVLARGDMILWVPGVGISEDAKLTDPDRALELTVEISGNMTGGKIQCART